LLVGAYGEYAIRARACTGRVRCGHHEGGTHHQGRRRQGLSHCERESLILNEDLTFPLSSISGASRKDTGPDSPSTGGIKLAPLIDTFNTMLARSYKGRGEVI